LWDVVINTLRKGAKRGKEMGDFSLNDEDRSRFDDLTSELQQLRESVDALCALVDRKQLDSFGELIVQAETLTEAVDDLRGELGRASGQKFQSANKSRRPNGRKGNRGAKPSTVQRRRALTGKRGSKP
jgi:hypothetical protein